MKRLKQALGGLLAAVLLAGCASAEASTPTGGDTGIGGSTCTKTNGQTISISGISDVQMQNSQAVYQAAQSLPLTLEDKDKAAIVGITVIWTEATAGAGYPYGQFNTGDVMNGVPTSSRGLFQQMSPWGSLEQRLDPVQSAGLFFNGGVGGQEGLLDIDGWQALPIEVAAQRVEKSQFADGRNYKPNIERAKSIVEALKGSVVCSPTGGNTGGDGTITTCQPGTDRAALAAKVLAAPNLKLRKDREASQTADLQTGVECNLLALVDSMLSTGLEIRLNSIKSDHDGPAEGDNGYHPKGMGMDLGYPAGDPIGAKVYEFLYKNVDAINLIQIIWAYPPTIDGIDPTKKCIQQDTNGIAATHGVKGDCDALYPNDISGHTDHIHVAVHR